jgi:hypothetical protein
MSARERRHILRSRSRDSHHSMDYVSGDDNDPISTGADMEVVSVVRAKRDRRSSRQNPKSYSKRSLSNDDGEFMSARERRHRFRSQSKDSHRSMDYLSGDENDPIDIHDTSKVSLVSEQRGRRSSRRDLKSYSRRSMSNDDGEIMSAHERRRRFRSQSKDS